MLTHIPVVFFTGSGIPGEVDEGLDTLEGAMAACMRAMKGEDLQGGKGGGRYPLVGVHHLSSTKPQKTLDSVLCHE